MSLYFILSIAFALSLDAFGVALSIGLNRGLGYKRKILFSISFGFFQFLFALLGGLMGIVFNRLITSVPSIAGGIVIAIVGVLMIKEGFSKDEKNMLLHSKMYIVLGISVSIDAMVLGFTILSSLHIFELTMDCLIVGITSLVVTLVAFIISRYLKKIKLVSSYAEYIGGIILIIFGLRMMFS
jgi:manganese efflux pump family protein